MSAGTDDPAPSDAELLRAHVDGDPDAFGILFKRHRDRLWAVALRTMGNPEDAADGLQDGLIAAFRRAGSFRGTPRSPPGCTASWSTPAWTGCARRRCARTRCPTTSTRTSRRGSLRTATDDALDPAEVSVADERRRVVLAALQTLPEEQRAALVLVDMEGYAMADVAQMLDCAVGTVKSRCSRGRAKLAELLAERLGALDADPPGDAGLGNHPPGRPVPSQDPPRGPPRGPPPARQGG